MTAAIEQPSTIRVPTGPGDILSFDLQQLRTKSLGGSTWMLFGVWGFPGMPFVEGLKTKCLSNVNDTLDRVLHLCQGRLHKISCI